MKTHQFLPANFTETSDVLKNPCCGYCRVLAYTPSEAADVQGWIAEFLNPQADSLLLLEINLKNYVKRSGKPSDPERKSHTEEGLSPAALKQIDAIFATAEKNHTDLIVRFLYDTEGKPEETEPKSLSRVKSHIRQLAALVNAHTACIFILQGCLTGAYGEMRHGRFSTPAVQKELISLLSDRIAPSIYLAVRTPALQRFCTQSPLSVTRENAFSGSLAARLGLFNDGIFGSDSDLGTYGTAFSALLPPADMRAEDHWKFAGSREVELAFQEKLCTFVPSGGEAVGTTEFSKYPVCIKDFMQMQVSYLNSDYSPDVMASWKERSCARAAQLLRERKSDFEQDKEKSCSTAEQSESTSIFDGASVYDYIGAHLGYRYLVTAAVVSLATPVENELVTSEESGHASPAEAAPGGLRGETLTFCITFENRGFAPAYRKFETRLILCPKTNQSASPAAAAAAPQMQDTVSDRILSYAIPFDNRFLAGNGDTTELTCSVPAKDLTAEAYEARLEMSDPVSGKGIQFANEPAGTSVILGTLG